MFKKVLYIEDNLYSRLLVKRILETKNIEVIEAENGLNGVDQAKRLCPDLIIIDINLPDIDGYEVTKRLRQMPQLFGTPIVALTSNVMKGDREKTLAVGCNGYIQKPIDIRLLPKQITAYL